jgi:glycerophosphoryl diester phosphodiesterase
VTSTLSRLVSLSAVAAIAHRGGAALRPENTLPAFAHAVALGVDGLECDVHLSRDGEVMVLHDPTLDRTTDARGPVSSLTAAELERVDAAYRFKPDQGFPLRGQGIGVPRLEQVLRCWPDVPLVVEIKGDRPEAAARVLEVLGRTGAEDRVVVGGFSLDVLRTIRQLRPAIVTSAASREAHSALRRSYFFVGPWRPGFRLFQVPMRLRDKPVLTRRFVRTARRAGLPVQVWVVDEIEEMRRLVDWGVTGIISDRPDIAVAFRDAWHRTWGRGTESSGH